MIGGVFKVSATGGGGARISALCPGTGTTVLNKVEVLDIVAWLCVCTQMDGRDLMGAINAAVDEVETAQRAIRNGRRAV